MILGQVLTDSVWIVGIPDVLMRCIRVIDFSDAVCCLFLVLVVLPGKV
ncbi:hypothetical protein CRENPOLYSF2_1070006 [Crenothrix polyspora]|uniref:Uncharacterized protein n=1 Tax=Crenothrix polyspora TaxID=360316 RepID=A0A1R4GZ61_9GAMM|nr:hypothetical protein CRENPOLYSF2_1070006 [Crenothrix polyspora]